MSGEKKRLEQFLLQSRASNIIQVDPRFDRFKPDQIDTIRLRSAQIEAGKKPVSEKLIKEQKKKKKKARRPKQLRGEVSRAIREQKRFERGERRDRPEEEPRIVGEPRNTGLSYDPDIERRRLDIQERQIADANLRALADRRAQAVAQERELAVRRGELAAGRAERRAAREAGAAPPPAPIVIPPAPAPDIRVEGPTINLPARADADPIPEIIRLGDRIRGDYNAFGVEQDARNREVLREIREQTEAQAQAFAQQGAQAADIRARQEETSETIREAVMRQDAINRDIQERIGLGEQSMSEARDSVVQEIRDAETRLRGAARDLNRPTSYDDVILRAAQREIRSELRTEPSRSRGGSLAEVTPSPSLARPSTPVTPEAESEPQPEPEALLASQTIGGDVIGGGGLFDLPSITIPEARLSTERDLTLSPDPSQRRQYPRGTGGTGPTRGGAGALRDTRLEQSTDAQEALRLGRLALEEAEPVLQLEEQEEFLSGSPREAPSTPIRSPIPPVLGGAQEADTALQALLATPSSSAGGEEFLPGVTVETPSTREEEALLAQQAEILEEQERSGVSEEPLRPVSQRIEEIERVIEPSGVQTQAELRPLDPDVLFEAIEEADEVGQVQDQRAQRIRDSRTTFQDSFPELSSEVRTGPRGKRGQRGGLGYRVRNNTDKPIKRIQPGDVVNVIGVEEGERGEGRYRLDTQTAAGTRVSLDEFGPLVDDGSLLFERGNRHELGGHFDQNPYGPLPQVEEPQGEPSAGLLQQGAEAVGGAVAGVVGGGARFAGGLAQGVGEGLVAQLPAAGDVGAALGRGAIAGVAGAGRLASGAVGAVLGQGEPSAGEEELGQEPEPEP